MLNGAAMALSLSRSVCVCGFRLFQKIDQLFVGRSDLQLNSEQLRLCERIHMDFCRLRDVAPPATANASAPDAVPPDATADDTAPDAVPTDATADDTAPDAATPNSAAVSGTQTV